MNLKCVTQTMWGTWIIAPNMKHFEVIHQPHRYDMTKCRSVSKKNHWRMSKEDLNSLLLGRCFTPKECKDRDRVSSLCRLIHTCSCPNKYMSNACLLQIRRYWIIQLERFPPSNEDDGDLITRLISQSIQFFTRTLFFTSLLQSYCYADDKLL